MSNNLLLEIGTEEIPARFMPNVLKQLESLATDKLKQLRIQFKVVKVYGTPRRMDLMVEGLAEKQADISTESKGPSIKVAFDGEGKATKAAQGFARGQNVAVEELFVKDDYVYATTGGELSTLKLGYLLKKTKGLKFIIHFHDPILYLKYQGLQFIHNTGFYYFREKALRKYLQAADLIITTSKTFYTTLIEEFNVDNNKIINNYFGYINKLELKQGFDISKIKIVYGGVFDRLQKPEILAKLLEKQNNCIINYVGEYKNYIPLQKYLDKQNINFYDNMPYNDYVNFATSNCNVGFVPLVEDYLKFCVPSKIYELINMGIPILGLLPDGDAMDIINKNGYGKAFKHNELDKFKNFVDELVEKPEELLKFRENILKDRDNWFIGNKFRDVITRISDL